MNTAGMSAAFIDWRSRWLGFAAWNRLVLPDAPLLVAIDGLDEAHPPPASTPLQVLPAPDALRGAVGAPP